MDELDNNKLKAEDDEEKWKVRKISVVKRSK